MHKPLSNPRAKYWHYRCLQQPTDKLHRPIYNKAVSLVMIKLMFSPRLMGWQKHQLSVVAKMETTECECNGFFDENQ